MASRFRMDADVLVPGIEKAIEAHKKRIIDKVTEDVRKAFESTLQDYLVEVVQQMFNASAQTYDFTIKVNFEEKDAK
jgi:hypothetical protein